MEQRKKANHSVADECVDLAMRKIRVLDKESGVIDFEEYPRARTLYAPVDYLKEKFAAPLAIPLLGIDPEKNFGALRKVIDGKRILLVGGGRSLGDVTSSRLFAPKALINVDPLLPYENVGRNSADYYKSFPLDPAKQDFVNEIRREGYGTFDEIWATFSIPNYCKTAEEIEVFFENIYEMLAPGGYIRIYPVGFYTEKMTEGELAERADELGRGLLSALGKLAEKDDIEMSAQNNSSRSSRRYSLTLLIHKLANQPDKS